MLELNRIYNMDCLEGMKQIPDGSIDLIATDPPYRVTPKGNNGTMGGHYESELTMKGRVFENNDIDIDDYLPEFYRVLKDGSHCYIMCNNVNLPHFFDSVKNSGFHFVKLLVWDKRTKICGTYYMSQVEHIFFLRKGSGQPIYDCGVSDLLSFQNTKDKNEDGSNIHNSQKPVGLMQTLIECSSLENEVVLDPFMGSGTTAIAALRSNRRYIGFELDEAYCDMANKRVVDEISTPKGGLF